MTPSSRILDALIVTGQSISHIHMVVYLQRFEELGMIIFHSIFSGMRFTEHGAKMRSYGGVCTTREVKQVFDAEDILCCPNNFWWIDCVVLNDYGVAHLRKNIRYRSLRV